MLCASVRDSGRALLLLHVRRHLARKRGPPVHAPVRLADDTPVAPPVAASAPPPPPSTASSSLVSPVVAAEGAGAAEELMAILNSNNAKRPLTLEQVKALYDQLLAAIDANGDGKLSTDEVAAFFKKQVEG